MDNIAHSLCGAALARTGWVRQGPLVTATLVLAANAPDTDALLYAFGDNMDALLYRRGWTHALITFLVQIPLLAGLFYGFGHWRGKRKGVETPHWRSLLAASTLGYLSHVGLDLLNTYGVRFLLPFDQSWYRGEMAFIVDPWMWLLFGTATLWGGEVRPRAYVLWGLLTALGTVAMSSRSVPLPAMSIWVVSMFACGLGRALKSSHMPLARTAVALVAIYLVGLKLASNAARTRGLEVIAQGSAQATLESTVNPTPAIPWRSIVVVSTEETIYRVKVDLLQPTGQDHVFHQLQNHLDDPDLPSLVGTRAHKVWRHFAQHPFVHREGNSIWLGDARYSYGGPEGMATVQAR